MDVKDRDEVRAVLGERAEATAYAHCVMNRESFDTAVMGYSEGLPEPFVIQVRPGVNRPLILTREQLHDLMVVHFADWIQQLIPYDFWGYRRAAYATMAKALGNQYLKAYEEMMEIQPEKYKNAVIPEMHKGQGSKKEEDNGGAKMVENWAQTMNVELSKFVWPESTEELVEVIKKSSKVRVAGARHSCAPLIESDGVIISTEKLNKILENM
jgi:hypothetical protein